MTLPAAEASRVAPRPARPLPGRDTRRTARWVSSSRKPVTRLSWRGAQLAVRIKATGSEICPNPTAVEADVLHGVGEAFHCRPDGSVGSQPEDPWNVRRRQSMIGGKGNHRH